MKRKTYQSEELGVSFSLPTAVTVREQLNMRGRLLETEGASHLRWWLAARPLIADWKCDLIPDLEAFDLDAIGDWRVGDVIQFVANESAGHMMGLADVPKN